MKILVVGWYHSPISHSVSSGTSTFAAGLAEGLAAAGHEVTLLSTPGGAARGVRVVEVSFSYRDIPAAHRLHDGFDEQFTDAAFSEACIRWALENHYRPDIIQDNHLAGALAAVLNVPLVVTQHHITCDALSRYYAGKHVVGISQHQKRRGEAAGIRYTAIIPHGLERENFITANWPARRGQNAPIVVGTLCRILPEKGIHLAAEAVAELRNQGHDARLEIVGHVDDHAYFQEYIHPHIEAGYAFYLGPKNAQEKAVWYANLDVFMQLTNRGFGGGQGYEETFGLTAQEALHSGVPTIVTDSGALPEQILDGVNGYVIPLSLLATDPDAFARRTAKAVLDATVLDQPTILGTISTQEGMIQRYIELYQRIIASKG